MSEPHLPDLDEIEASGTASWVDQAVQHHKKKQDKLSRMLGGEKESIRKEKDALAQAFSRIDEQEEEEVDRGPDLFAKERQSAQSSRQSLSQMFGAEKEAKNEETDALRNLFGAPASGSGKKKGKR